MTTLTLQQACDACQTNKTAWLNRKSELALSVWLTAGNEINYSAQDTDILTAIGYRPDAPSRDDNREKFTPAQNMIYARRRAGLAAQ
ncbi:TPA: hypothetical protein G9A28_000036 [Salmonella enterica]|uniref:Phage polarity suppression protein n=1 Tax=Salmonella enterica TaxID=28901 RepID=A0A750Q905_SALER|nr:hypothetical protein [Salmonella enterica]HAF6473653.1 hypothetical protein [Salmonella enterica]HCM2304329.1 hypothetical protein [Salmonella enterica subsp. enterica serovar Stanley]